MNRIIASGMLAMFTTAAFSQTWTEVGDAGELVPSRQKVTGSGSLTAITGGLSDYDKDLFEIYITDPAQFVASTSSNSDPMLFLFSEDGTFITGNDDYSGYQSYITGSSSLSAGRYLVGITRFSNDPLNATGGAFRSGATGQLASWENSHNGSMSYTINLTGASFVGVSSVPAPAAALAFGLGMLRRRRRS